MKSEQTEHLSLRLDQNLAERLKRARIKRGLNQSEGLRFFLQRGLELEEAMEGTLSSPLADGSLSLSKDLSRLEERLKTFLVAQLHQMAQGNNPAVDTAINENIAGMEKRLQQSIAVQMRQMITEINSSRDDKVEELWDNICKLKEASQETILEEPNRQKQYCENESVIDSSDYDFPEYDFPSESADGSADGVTKKIAQNIELILRLWLMLLSGRPGAGKPNTPEQQKASLKFLEARKQAIADILRTVYGNDEFVLAPFRGSFDFNALWYGGLTSKWFRDLVAEEEKEPRSFIPDVSFIDD